MIKTWHCGICVKCGKPEFLHRASTFCIGFQSEQEIPRHKKRIKKNKQFKIQVKYPNHQIYGGSLKNDGWTNWYRKYTSIKRAMQAVNDLKKSHRFIGYDFRVEP